MYKGLTRPKNWQQTARPLNRRLMNNPFLKENRYYRRNWIDPNAPETRFLAILSTTTNAHLRGKNDPPNRNFSWGNPALSRNL